MNPESVEEIKIGMKVLFERQDLRKELVERGYENVKKYSPKRFAKEIVDIVDKMRKNKMI